jgi:hypothetical protein
MSNDPRADALTKATMAAMDRKLEPLAEHVAESLKSIHHSFDGIKTKLDAYLTMFAARVLTKDLMTTLEGLVDLTKAYVKEQTAPLTERIETLEETLDKIGKGAYRGTWKSGETYSPGEFVTDRGALWHARHETSRRPGNTDSWQLAVRRGGAEHVERL